MLKFKFKSKYKLDSSKLCEFCIYRVFLTGTPLKVSVYIEKFAKKVHFLGGPIKKDTL